MLCDRALKHWMVSASCGCKESLDTIRKMLKKGVAMKGDKYDHIKHTWIRLEVLRGMKLQHLMSSSNIIDQV